MAFNLGAGIANMADSIAKMSGTALLDMEKSNLEEKKIKLADQLAAARESAGRKETFANQSLLQGQAETAATAGREQEHGYRKDEAEHTSLLNTSAEKGLIPLRADAQVNAQDRIARNAADLTKTLAKDPEYVKSAAAMARAMKEADPAVMATVEREHAATALDKFKLASANKLSDLQDQLGKATTDAAKAQLRDQIEGLTTDADSIMKDRTGKLAAATLDQSAWKELEKDLDAANTKLSTINENDNPTGFAALKSNIARLETETAQAKAIARVSQRNASTAYGNEAPIPDGRYKGEDGNLYEVRGGVKRLIPKPTNMPSLFTPASPVSGMINSP